MLKYLLPMLLLVACSPTSAKSPTLVAGECIAHRTALQLACVSANPAKIDSDACRARVQAEHDCTVTDGGVE